mmetsp:Transcript_17495/g.52242  ORF Transcript_17495/g.52242 Transcript_17495/m.52242 type:complete len:212 (+) Transcript_17495:329-964(+)
MLRREADLAPGVFEAELHLLLRLGAATPETLLQGAERGRRHEHEARGLRERRPLHLLRALHVDVQNADAAVADDLLHGLEGRAVDVAVHLRVLYEVAVGDRVSDLILGGEVVVHAVLLARPGLPRRVGDGEAEAAREFAHQALDQGALADAGRPDDHYDLLSLAAALEEVQEGVARPTYAMSEGAAHRGNTPDSRGRQMRATPRWRQNGQP